MLWNAGLGAYHAGVEWKLWAGPAGLLGRARRISAPPAACSTSCKAIRVVRCDEAAWRFLGISLAGYNAMISLVLALIAAWGALRARGRTLPPGGAG